MKNTTAYQTSYILTKLNKIKNNWEFNGRIQNLNLQKRKRKNNRDLCFDMQAFYHTFLIFLFVLCKYIH